MARMARRFKRADGMNLWQEVDTKGHYVTGGISVVSARLVNRPKGPYKVEWQGTLFGNHQASFDTQTEALKYAKAGCPARDAWGFWEA